MKKNNLKYIVSISLVLIISIASLIYTTTSTQTINLIANRSANYEVNFLTSNVTLKNPDRKIILNGESKDSYSLEASNNLEFLGKNEGSYKLTAKLFNLVPIKSINVNVMSDTLVYPSGAIIGVRLDTKGVIVVDFEEIETAFGKKSPAKEAKLYEGDVITHINGKPVNTASEFRSRVSMITDRELKLDLIRKDVKLSVKLRPVKSSKDGSYKTGMWVRDNVAGIGTLTCVTQDKKNFCALGHAITDSSTGIVIPLKDGDLLKADVVSLVKGEKNHPGEIRGIFTDINTSYGNIIKNDEYGIYGEYTNEIDGYYDKPISIAMQNEITTGKATIISTIEDRTKEYDIEIEKVNYKNVPSTKCMLIKITDKELLDQTGGIIQGMSGSPIIQDGKLIGAVTHVLVNDPTRGYGIFIENML